MKKIVLLLTLGSLGLANAQYYPNSGYQDSWYDTYDEGNYFSDDYYYEYPQDYYDDGYYEDMYSDYRRSVSQVNWDRFFTQMRLSPQQISLIIDLNRQFPSYGVWNSYYRVNPVRWFYDRFYALERILGPRVFVVFQNRYYNGYSPVVYYTNHWTNYYGPRYRVRPAYTHVNINVYHVNRRDFHQHSANRFGWNEPRNYNTNNVNGFRASNNRAEASQRNTVRNDEVRRNSNSENRNESSRVNSNRNQGIYQGNSNRGNIETRRSEAPRQDNSRRNYGEIERNTRSNENRGMQQQPSRSQQERRVTPNPSRGESGNSTRSQSQSRGSVQRFTQR